MAKRGAMIWFSLLIEHDIIPDKRGCCAKMLLKAFGKSLPKAILI